MLKLSFQNYTKVKISQKIFTDLLKKAGEVLRAMRGRGGEIVLALTTDKEIKKLNKEKRKIAKPTDVLSFSYLNARVIPDNLIGEIVISVETAARQAKEYKVPLTHELRRLFVHGLLHVFGYTHNTDKSEREMEKAAEKTLAPGGTEI